jgi:hypothetical protein
VWSIRGEVATFPGTLRAGLATSASRVGHWGGEGSGRWDACVGSIRDHGEPADPAPDVALHDARA